MMIRTALTSSEVRRKCSVAVGWAGLATSMLLVGIIAAAILLEDHLTGTIGSTTLWFNGLVIAGAGGFLFHSILDHGVTSLRADATGWYWTERGPGGGIWFVPWTASSEPALVRYRHPEGHTFGMIAIDVPHDIDEPMPAPRGITMERRGASIRFMTSAGLGLGTSLRRLRALKRGGGTG